MPFKMFLNQLFDHKENSVEVVIVIAKLLELRISDSTLIRELETHPEHGSLLSISDSLNFFGIDTVGVVIEESEIENISMPFITQISVPDISRLYFTVVKAIDNKSIHFFDPLKHDWNVISLDEFIGRCSMKLLLIDDTNLPSEPDYESKVKSENHKKYAKYLSWLSIPSILLIYIIFHLTSRSGFSLDFILFSIFSLLGVGMCLMIIWYELDVYNPALNQICNSSSRNINCSAVLSSKGSEFFGVGWSIWGVSYFSSLILMIFFVGLDNTVATNFVTFTTIVAAPYIIFSIYYQWKIVKSWCIFCLLTLVILLAHVIIMLSGNWISLMSWSNFTFDNILRYIVCFLIPFLSATSLYNYAKNTRYNNVIRKLFQKVKGNPQVLESMLRESKQVSEAPQQLGIRLGSKEAEFEIIKVCNPYCDPCAKAHPLLEQLLDSNNRVSVKILFHIYPGSENSYSPPAKHLLAIAEQGDETTTRKALHDWYNAKEKKYTLFAEKYPLSHELKEQDVKIEAMQGWCKKADISSTPTFFIKISSRTHTSEGYFQLPDFYNISDLKYILPSL